MSTVWLYSLLSVAVVSLLSFVGAFTLAFGRKKIQEFLLILVSFSAGALLGDVFIHLLPEIAEESGFVLQTSLYILGGIVSTFVIEKIIHWRHMQEHGGSSHVHPVTTLTILGDGLHNFVDGIIIAGSYLVSIPLGISTTIAVILHEVPQELGNFGVLIHGGLTVKKALFYNFISALTAVVGAVVVLSWPNIEGRGPLLASYTAGAFIYIAGSDLIPELHKETNVGKNVIQFIALLAGIAVMLALLLLE